MTTVETVASVKAQSRVLYTDVTGTTHNAIATDVPHLGYNQGLKRFSAFLNLVFLNEAGQTIKISAAPMIGEVDDEYLAQAAVFTAKHDVAWHNTSNKEELINDHLEVIKTHLPITIGWQIDPDATVESAAPPTLAPDSAEQTQPTLPVVSDEETAGTTYSPELVQNFGEQITGEAGPLEIPPTPGQEVGDVQEAAEKSQAELDAANNS